MKTLINCRKKKHRPKLGIYLQTVAVAACSLLIISIMVM